MNSPLNRLRESTRADVELALVDAKQRKEALLRQVEEIDEEIRLAEAWLGGKGAPPVGVSATRSRMTLQDAMRTVLEDGGNVGLRPDALAEAITERGLYRMRDGRAVGAHSVQARVTNYSHLFVRENGLIRVRAAS